MKTKGITIWEQYLEHIVVGVAVIVFLVFTAMQFIGNPNAAEVGGTTYEAASVDEALVTRADQLQQNLTPGSPSPIDVPAPQTIGHRIEDALRSPVSVAATLPIVHAQVPLTRGDLPRPDQRYVSPEIDPPFDVCSAQTFDALAQSELERVPDLADRFDGAYPDMTWVSVAATFDVDAALAEFQRGDQVNDLAPVPASWYSGVQVIDVIVERQELVDGQWSDAEVLDPIPGQESLRSMIAKVESSSQRDEFLSQFKSGNYQRAIVQPSPYTTVRSNWVVPDCSAASQDDVAVDQLTDEELQIRRLQRRLAGLQKRLENVMAQLEELGGPLEGPSEDKDPPSDDDPSGGEGGNSPGGLGPGAGGGGTGGRGSRGGSDRGTDRKNDGIRRTLTRNMHTYERRIADVTDELEAMIGETLVEETVETDEQPFMSEGSVRMWAHDIDIEYGRTYRYRFSVEVYNPFFARKFNLVEEQHELAERFTLQSSPSEWSEPITVKPPTRMFVTSASTRPLTGVGSGADLGRANVEIYRFSHGRWWVESFQVSPGDRIGSEKSVRVRDGGESDADMPEAIDYSTEWFLVDIQDVVDPNSDPRYRDRQSIVYLQNSMNGELVVRDCRMDAGSTSRERLEDEVDLADAGI
jgi:hypothetical protein